MILLQYKLSKLKWCDLTNLANTPNEDLYFSYKCLGKGNHLLAGHCCREVGTSKSMSYWIDSEMNQYVIHICMNIQIYLKKFTHALYIYTYIYMNN